MSKSFYARLSGAIYLVVVLTGLFSLLYVPSELFVSGDAEATLVNIKANQTLFAWGAVAEVCSYIFFLLLPLALYALFRAVDQKPAVIMVALACVSAPMAIMNVVKKVDLLHLLRLDDGHALMGVDYINAQAAFLLSSYNSGTTVTQVFWGLWLIPFGYLVFKSGYLPKIFGVLLMLGPISYVGEFFLGILTVDAGMPAWLSVPAALGEIGTCLWLLLMGIKEPTSERNQY